MTTAPATAGILDASWTVPTTNTDGSALTDLASYRLYYGTASSPCQGPSSVQVASPTSTPGPNQTLAFKLAGLTAGTLYNVAVSAVDASGHQSLCSSIASAVARVDFALNPTGTVNFGSVNLGSFTEQTFIVSNTGGGTVSGTASVTAPFSIVQPDLHRDQLVTERPGHRLGQRRRDPGDVGEQPGRRRHRNRDE